MSTLRMPNINQVALSGRLVQDPELRFMDNGSARLRGRIAVNRSYRDRNDEWQEETSFFDIVLWQKATETFAERLHKGTPVFTTGRLQSHSWRDGEEQTHFPDRSPGAQSASSGERPGAHRRRRRRNRSHP